MLLFIPGPPTNGVRPGLRALMSGVYFESLEETVMLALR